MVFGVFRMSIQLALAMKELNFQDIWKFWSLIQVQNSMSNALWSAELNQQMDKNK